MARLGITKRTARERISSARTRLILDSPFYGILAMHLEIDEHPQVDTMATDGKRLLFDPTFVDGISDEELRGVVAHEVLHCVYCHPARLADRDPKLWNVACDYAINLDLIDDGFTLPESRLLSEHYRDMSADQIYSDLKRHAEESPSQSWGDVISPETPQDGQQPPSLAEQEAEWKERAAMASMAEAGANKARDKAQRAANGKQDAQGAPYSGSSVPGSIVPGASSVAASRFMGKLKAPKESWSDILRNFVTETSSVDYTWSRPNRRHIGEGIYLPGKAETKTMHVVAMVDISGSISHDLYAQFMSELQAMLDEDLVTKLSVVFANTRVTETREFCAGDILHTEVNTGGGTAFSDSMRWIVDNAGDAACGIYFTDMCCHDFGEDPGIPIIWAHYGTYGNPAPFGDTVRFEQ